MMFKHAKIKKVKNLKGSNAVFVALLYFFNSIIISTPTSKNALCATPQ